MLGVVFTEFMDMVDDRFGEDVLDQIIDDAGVSGAYTAVGNYPFAEMVALIGALSRQSGVEAPVLIETFGEYLFGQFSDRYTDLVEGQQDILEFLSGIEERIHVEVRKLYPTAELPFFSCERPAADTLVMHYESPKCLGHLAMGLLKGCSTHFSTPLSISVAEPDMSGSTLTFTVKVLPAHAGQG